MSVLGKAMSVTGKAMSVMGNISHYAHTVREVKYERKNKAKTYQGRK